MNQKHSQTCSSSDQQTSANIPFIYIFLFMFIYMYRYGKDDL